MAAKHCARVCAVGSEADMKRLLTLMLDNVAWGEDEDSRDLLSVKDLLAKVTEIARADGGEGDEFLYEMISVHRYGDAVPGTCRMTLREEPCGLWTCTFAFESDHAFQTHEWVDLHRRSDRVTMVAQRAGAYFMAEKGEIILAGGEAMDNWDAMAECWLWLMERYCYGMPPEDAVEVLRGLEKTLRDEEYDLTVAELLTSCMNNLEAIALDVQDSDALREALAGAAERRDFGRVLEYRHMVAESALWETDRNARWLATLGAVYEAWTGETAD